MNLNRVFLMGNLTRDVELRYLQSGMAVTDLGLALNHRYRRSSDGETVEEVCFVDVTVWGKTAENCNQYLSKGSGVFIEGRLKMDTWETPEGQKRSKHKVVADRVQFLPKRGEGGQERSTNYGSSYHEDSSSYDSTKSQDSEYGDYSGGGGSGGGMSGYQDENVPF